MRRWRGLKALVHDAVDRTTDLVGVGHESTARVVMQVTDRIEPVSRPARIVNAVRRVSTAGVLGTIKVVNRAIEAVSDAGLDVAEESFRTAATETPAVPMRSDAMTSATWVGDAALGLVNAVVGDHLAEKNNGLDLGMVFRVGDTYVSASREILARALPAPSPKVVLFVHGLGTTEWSWCLESLAYHGDATTSFGTLLAADLGYTPVWLRYNTGRRVSSNGRQLAADLQRFVDAYPIPIEELALVGHSMGGLVLRSACHYATEDGLAWAALVRHVICLGTPHQGAPLEKLGNLVTGLLGAIDLPGTQVTARILEGRSAGIKDLRHGSLVDEDWLGRDPDALLEEAKRAVPLLPRASYHFVSATVTRDPQHPFGQLIGDLLVRVPSSAGPILEERTFAIETSRFGGVMHHQLQNHPAIYAVVRAALAGQH
jgi:triacylglycerol lipase